MEYGADEIRQPQQGQHRHQHSSSHAAGHSTYSTISEQQQGDLSTQAVVLKKSKSTLSMFTRKK